MLTTKKYYLLGVVIVLMAVVLGACGSTATETPEPVSQETDFIPVISATGKLVPQQEATLSISTSGVVAEVLAETGAEVAQGDVLVRLQGSAQQEAAIAAARLELTNAEVALSQLTDGTDLLAAQALQTIKDKEQALEDLVDVDLQQALALQAIADASKAVADAERMVNIRTSTASQADIDAADAQVILARDKLEKAEEDYEPYANKPENNLERANYKAKLAAAQQEYDAAVRRLNGMTSTGNEVDIAVARANLATAQAELAEAEQEWERVKDGPDEADIALLEAQIADAERDYDIYSQGPDPDDVAKAEARLENATAQLAAAEATLEDMVLTAPFDGTVGDVLISAGEWVSLGAPVVLIADLGHLVIETTDLNEIDVAQLQVGDLASVSFDAQPDGLVEATIVRIAPKSEEGAGVNYTVTLEPDELPANLRWGMTAFVDIENDR